MKKTQENKRIIINKEISVIVPEGYLYSDKSRELKDRLSIVFMREEKNDYYENTMGDREFSIAIPFFAPRCLVLSNPISLEQVIGQETESLNEEVRALIGMLPNNILSDIAHDNGVEPDIITLKDNDQIMMHYARINEKTAYFTVMTPKNVYTGQIIINDTEDEKDIINLTNTWLGGIERYIFTDADKTPSDPFTMPTYQLGKRATMLEFSVAIPDQTVSLEEAALQCSEKGEEFEFVDLMDEFKLLAITDDVEGDFSDYMNARIAMVVSNGSVGRVKQLEDCWEGFMSIMRQDTIVSYIKGYCPDDQTDDVKYLELDNHVAIAYTMIRESTDQIEQWASYLVGIIHEDKLIFVNIHLTYMINKELMDQAVSEWVQKIELLPEEEVQKFEKNETRKALGSYVGENGKMDAIKLVSLFYNDVVFQNEDEVTYENGHHVADSFQFNSAEIDNYPEIKQHLDVFHSEILNILRYVEQNENLVVPREMCEEEILSATFGFSITGMTVFFMIAYYVISIEQQSENEYKVVADRNIISGIPQFTKYISEFIKTLRDYNELEDPFTVMVEGTVVEVTPYSDISPVFGADDYKKGGYIEVQSGEHPYENVCAELEHMQEEGVNHPFCNTDKWETTVLEDGTVKIVGYNGDDIDVFVPEEIGGRSVSVIGEQAFSPMNENNPDETNQRRFMVQKVHIPGCVKRIEESAFLYCPLLQEVELAEGIEEIGSSVFMSCMALEKVVFPKSVKQIGDTLFVGCGNLQRVVFPSEETCEIDPMALVGAENVTVEYHEAEEDYEAEETVSGERLEFSFEQNMRARGEGYTIGVPDGFRFVENVDEVGDIMKDLLEGRDFIMYTPDIEDASEYGDAKVSLLASTNTPNPFTEEAMETQKMMMGLAFSMMGFESESYTYENADTRCLYVYQDVGEGRANYHIMFGNEDGTHQLRLILDASVSVPSICKAIEDLIQTVQYDL